MADTIGMLVDKLATVNQKMFLNQEILYEIRRMSFESFKSRYLTDENGAAQLWESLKKACDLNVQRNALITEVDQKIVEIVKAAVSGENLDNGQFVQNQHKTY